MNYLKFTQYVYLVAAAFFIYDGVKKLNAGEEPWLSFIIGALSIFMFFFRRKYAKRFEKREQDSNDKS